MTGLLDVSFGPISPGFLGRRCDSRSINVTQAPYSMPRTTGPSGPAALWTAHSQHRPEKWQSKHVTVASIFSGPRLGTRVCASPCGGCQARCGPVSASWQHMDARGLATAVLVAGGSTCCRLPACGWHLWRYGLSSQKTQRACGRCAFEGTNHG